MASTEKTETEDLREKLDALKRDFADVARTAKQRAVKGTTDWVQEHPFGSIGIGAGVGLLLGLLIGRKRP
jgi:ElaB/YqjD/DUF883 family membrane-anchored ribosome-binding protein